MAKTPKRNLIVDDELLKDFINGKLDASVEQKVAAYIETRPKLQSRVAALSGDGFLERLKESGGRAEHRTSRPPPGPLGQSASPTAPNDIPAELAAYDAYEVLKELGRGGMGVVYLAKNIEMDRLEVLKVLNPGLLDHEAAKQRFRTEIRAIAKLNHPAIVTPYSILPISSFLVFAMEYVQGVDLHQFIYQHERLPIPLACSLAKQLADGLQHAHEQCLVHRDIKPANAIVFQSSGQFFLKILDFGLAKATSERTGAGLTQDGAMLGTPEYMAPEQILNAAKADIRADIYSLGCTLYHMLVGEPPFAGTPFEIMSAHQRDEPTAIRLRRPEIPSELEDVISQMMAKDAAKRFQSPCDVSDVLLPFIGLSRPNLVRSETPVASDTVNQLGAASVDTSVVTEAPAISVVSHERRPQSRVSSISSTGPRSKTRRRSQKRGNNFRRWWPWLALGLIVAFIATGVALSILKVKTKAGTIVIEKFPKDAEILVDGEKVVVNWRGTRAEISVKPGTREVQLKSGDLIVAGQTVQSLQIASGATIVARFEADRDVNAESPPEFEQIFNGRSFDGWSGETTKFEIVDGILKCKKGERATIFTAKQYADFVVELEFRLDKGSNDGLAIRYPGYGDPAHTGMCELQVLDSSFAEYAKLDTRQLNASAFGLVSAKQGFLRRIGEWNAQRITIVKSRIKVELNGSVVLDEDLSKVKRDMHGNPYDRATIERGHFGLAGLRYPVEYRNIRIKELYPIVNLNSGDRTSASLQRELLLNSGFEELSSSNNGWRMLSGQWSKKTASRSISPVEGQFLLEAAANTISELRQEVDLSQLGDTIDTAGLQAIASIYSSCTSPDSCELVLEYRDASGQLLETATSGQTTVKQTKWNRLRVSSRVPSKCRKLALRLLSRNRRQVAVFDAANLEIAVATVYRSTANESKVVTASHSGPPRWNENLVKNGSGEEALATGGRIPNWTAVSGDWKPWKGADGVTNIPDGQMLLNSGNCRVGELKQVIPVGRFADDIDSNRVACSASAFVTSWNQRGRDDSTEMLVEYLDQNRVSLDYYASSELTVFTRWRKIGDHRIVKPGTRYIAVSLITRRYVANWNHGQFDDVSIILRRESDVAKVASKLGGKAEELGGLIDLLSQLDTKQHSVSGDWKNFGGVLTSPGIGVHAIELPAQPNGPYELILDCTRRSGIDGAKIGIVVADKQAAVVLDSWPGKKPNGRSGLSLIDGVAADKNATSTSGNPVTGQRWLPSHKKVRVVIRVTAESINVKIDDVTAIDFTGRCPTLSS